MPASTSPGLFARLRERIRYLHYSLRTEEAYVYWARSFVRFHGMRHPRELGQGEIERFLAHLANERHVSVSTHKQALCALLFLYREVLGHELPWMQEIGRPKSKVSVPVVLSREEVARLLAAMDGVPARIACTRVLELVLGLAGIDAVDRSAQSASSPASSLSGDDRPCDRAGGWCCRNRQAGYGAHASSLVRDSPARVRCRYSQSAGVARAQRCQHDHDLHTRAEIGSRGNAEPAGCAAGGEWCG